MRKRNRPRPLLRAVVELANAANAVRPLTRDSWNAIPVFFLGWPASELAPWLGTASVIDTLRRWRRGDFNGRTGPLAIALTAVSWVLLAFVHQRNLRSMPYYEEPLRDALGENYKAVVRPSRIRLAAGLFRAGSARRRYVERADTVRYGPHRANRADIWHRRDLRPDAKAPVLVNIPGGAWVIGMRRPQAYPLMGHLADEGWVCVSIGYRVSPLHTWPDQIVDVKRALAWVKENIADYGGDPDFIALSGGSAGGHMTALAALTPNDPQWQPGFEDADTSVVAAVPVYGRYDMVSTEGVGRGPFVKVLLRWLVMKKDWRTHPEIYRDASPINHIRPDAPPFFVLHGTNDSLIAVEEARDFVAALEPVSQAPVVYAEIPGAQHAFDIFGSSHGHYTAVAIARFLDWVRGMAVTGRDVTEAPLDSEAEAEAAG
ncbi:esterase [Mycolicibacterium insubricum]|uniref:Esterase n=3 Tax=Mycolicibacterium insubricum TaxID=444597 RepID=A0A1X0DCZ8_9MYCO|nr:alpha/beta hydrolase [Mycolicibacterium insubricum]MCB9440473.1 alpha/beta hydrolase [Mycolicibacterium sp.]ORA70275.1 esterase [Mycolicibacterium insubricum]BBZ65407.1 esterase [Mycolicibacterium insubricum]